MSTEIEQKTLPGCSVLPRVNQSDRSHHRHRGTENKPPKSENAQPVRHNTADRFYVLNTFVDYSMQKLSKAEISVWLVLYRDTKDGTARTAQSDIARRAGVNVRTVKRAIANLGRQELLRVVHRGSVRCGPSSYRVVPLEGKVTPVTPCMVTFCVGNWGHGCPLSHKGP